MAATTVDTMPPTTSARRSPSAGAATVPATAGGRFDASAVDALLAGTGGVVEVERWPDEHPAGLFPADDPGFREIVADGGLACYEISLTTASGTALAGAVVWSSPGVVCGPYASCTALGAGLADEVADLLGRALTRR